MDSFDPHTRVSHQVMIWQRQGTWTRYLGRYLEGGPIYWSELTFVEPDRPVCLACLSHQVEIVEGEVLTCLACHATYRFV